MEDGRNICTVIFSLCMCVVDDALIVWGQCCQWSREESLSNCRYFVKLGPWYTWLSSRFQHPSTTSFHSSWTDDCTHLHHPAKTHSISAKHWFPSLCLCIAGLVLKPPGSGGGLALRLFSRSIQKDDLTCWITECQVKSFFQAEASEMVTFQYLEVHTYNIYCMYYTKCTFYVCEGLPVKYFVCMRYYIAYWMWHTAEFCPHIG